MLDFPYVMGGSGESFSFTFDGKFQYPEEVVIPNTVTTLQSNSAAGFYQHTEIKKVTFAPGSTVTGGTRYGSTFMSCTGLEYAELPPSFVQGSSQFFRGCTALKTVKFNSTGITGYLQTPDAAHMLYLCTALEDVQVPSGWTTDLAICNDTMSRYFTTVLTHDSMVALINNLYDYSGGTAHTLTLGSANLSRLSAAEIAVATNKNWTVS